MSSTERFAKLSHEVKYDLEGRRLCRFCPNPVPKGRRTWCSLRCVENYFIASDASFARRKVWMRDKGVCALCGVNTDAIRAHMRWLVKQAKDDSNPYQQMFWDALTNLKAHLKTKYNAARSAGHFWQADHIVPVCEGGGEARLDNLRTLCTPCHKAETAKLATRRAELRRAHTEQLMKGALTVEQKQVKYGQIGASLLGTADWGSTPGAEHDQTRAERDQAGAQAAVVRSTPDSDAEHRPNDQRAQSGSPSG